MWQVSTQTPNRPGSLTDDRIAWRCSNRCPIDEPWPAADPAALVQESVEIVVQVNGKLRGRVRVAADADESSMRGAALADENVRRFIGAKPVRKTVVVPGKLVNIVVLAFRARRAPRSWS